MIHWRKLLIFSNVDIKACWSYIEFVIEMKNEKDTVFLKDTSIKMRNPQKNRNFFNCEVGEIAKPSADFYKQRLWKKLSRIKLKMKNNHYGWDLPNSVVVAPPGFKSRLRHGSKSLVIEGNIGLTLCE